MAETYDEGKYDSEIRGIIDLVKSFAEKYGKRSRSFPPEACLIIKTCFIIWRWGRTEFRWEPVL